MNGGIPSQEKENGFSYHSARGSISVRVQVKCGFYGRHSNLKAQLTIGRGPYRRQLGTAAQAKHLPRSDPVEYYRQHQSLALDVINLPKDTKAITVRSL